MDDMRKWASSLVIIWARTVIGIIRALKHVTSVTLGALSTVAECRKTATNKREMRNVNVWVPAMIIRALLAKKVEASGHALVGALM